MTENRQRIRIVVRLFLAFAALSGFLLASACGTKGGSGGEETAGGGKTGGYTVTDVRGRTVHLAGKPQRIVSLTYGTDEILLAVAGEQRIAAFSRWAGEPGITFITKEEADRVGKLHSLASEEILRHRPDLIVASVATAPELVKTLEQMNVPVYLAGSPDTYGEMKAKVAGVAAAVGEPERGRAVTDRMDRNMAALEQRLSCLPKERERTAVAFNFVGAMGYRDGLIDHMLRLAHIRNGAVLGGLNARGQTLSKEQVVAVNPDAFLLPTWNYDKRQDVEAYAAQIASDPAYRTVKAVQSHRLLFVSDRYRYVASQYLPEAVEAFARAVYPELFTQEGLQ